MLLRRAAVVTCRSCEARNCRSRVTAETRMAQPFDARQVSFRPVGSVGCTIGCRDRKAEILAVVVGPTRMDEWSGGEGAAKVVIDSFRPTNRMNRKSKNSMSFAE
jgi:hypothetical protein